MNLLHISTPASSYSSGTVRQFCSSMYQGVDFLIRTNEQRSLEYLSLNILEM